jgi:hypothetical protein
LNLALPTILVVVGLIPGIAFVNSYYAGRFPRELARLSTLAELALYFFWALVVDVAALHIFAGSIQQDSASIVLRILSSPVPADLQQIADRLGGSGWSQLAIQYISTVGLSGLVGIFLRRIAWAFRWDVYFPLLRMKSEWFYTLQGRLPGLSRLRVPVADVLVEHPEEGSRLYAGIVAAISSTEDGELDQLLLVATQRHSGRGPLATLKDIPGKRFVIMGRTIHSINMRYHEPRELGLPQPSSWWGTVGSHLWAITRSLLFEEP